MDKHMTKNASGVQSKAWGKHLPWLLALLLVGMALAGGNTVFGNSPFCVAAIAAVTGVGNALAVTIGALLGSLHHGGILPMVIAGVFLLRGAWTLWMTAGSMSAASPASHSTADPSPSGKSTKHTLRHSRTQGWLIPENRPKTITASHVQYVPHIGNKDPSSTTPPGRAKTIVFGEGNGSLFLWANQNLFREGILLRMAISALGAFLAGAWGLIAGHFQPIDLWGMLFSTLLSPVCTYLLYAAHDRHMRTSPMREVGILFSLALICRSLSGITLPLIGVDLGQSAALTAAILTGSSFGVSRGAMVGLSCGLFLTPAYVPAYAIAGAVTGALSGSFTLFFGRGYSRAIGLLAGSIAGIAWCLYSAGLSGLSGLAPELLIVSAIFLPFFSYDGCKLPAHWCGVLPDTRRTEQAALSETAYRGREKKLTDLGENLRSIGEMLTGVSEKLIRPTRWEMQEMAEGCFAVYCDRCKERCMEKNPHAWQEMMGQFAHSLLEDGGVCGRDVPPGLAAKCMVMGRVLDEINATAAKRLGERRQGDRLRVTAEDYTYMGKLLGESARLEAETSIVDKELTARLSRMLSEGELAAGSVRVYGNRYKRIFVHDIDLTGTRMGGEEIAALFGKAIGMPLSTPTFSLDGELLSMELHTRHCAHCICGRCSVSAEQAEAVRNGNRTDANGMDANGMDANSIGVNDTEVDSDGDSKAIDYRSGDTISAFVGDGKQYMLLSDGMGTGRMAALTSGMVSAFLTRMLTSGATLETALKMLNSVLRASGTECAATLDLCEIDLLTMEVCFIKSGAAPSFILRGGSLFRLQSKTVPIGILRALDAEKICFSLEPGDTIILLSDGIARSFEECPWLLELLTTNVDLQKGNVQAAAETIVREAACHGAIDDITAGVVLVESEG